MIMAHISVSNHFKRQEKALSDKILALRGFISSPLAMFLKENLKKMKKKLKGKEIMWLLLKTNPCNYPQSKA